MLTSATIKSLILSLGADKCGIAGIDRMTSAPKGFHPTDIWKDSRSVVVFLKRMPDAVIHAENPVPYTVTANLIYNELDRIGLEFSYAIEKENIRAVPVTTDVPYLSWDENRKHGMGILSLRHAAFHAGLGILGRNTLLINRDWGNMVYIGAVLVDKEFESDAYETSFTCPEDCRLCLDICPSGALDGITVIQEYCRKISCLDHPRGWEIYACNECRKVCPLRNGKPEIS